MGRPIKQPPIRLVSVRAKYAGSAVSTGQKMFAEGGDGRSVWGRRWRDLILVHAADLGGLEDLSEAQISICRRAAALECELESMEARLSEGQCIDLAVYARLIGCLCRLFELIGIKRVTKPLDPTVALAKSWEPYAGLAVDDGDEDDEAQ